MGIMDKMPHRMLVNQSLRKEAEELRKCIEEYQSKYDEKCQKYVGEIEHIQEKYKKEVESATYSIGKELKKEGEVLTCLQNELYEYINLFFDKKLVQGIKKIKVEEKKSTKEYIGFLSTQMGMIGQEIKLFRERKDILSRKAEVDDLVELIRLSNGSLILEYGQDAKSLLNKITVLITEIDDDEKLLKNTLIKLRSMIQNRVDMMPLIQYIEWIIQQKIQQSKDCKYKRKELCEVFEKKTKEIDECKKEIDAIQMRMNEKAKMIRSYWSKPILYIRADIDYKKSRKSIYLFEIKDINEDIQRMKTEHSSDSLKWNSLWDKKRLLKDNISQLNLEIEGKEREFNEWKIRQNAVFEMCKKNGVYLLRGGRGTQSDEYLILTQRLQKLERIKADGEVVAKKEYTRKKAQLLSERSNQLKQISKQIESTKENCEKLEKNVKKAQETLDKYRREDNRFFLIKFIFETKYEEEARKKLLSYEARKKQEDELLVKLKDKYKAVEQKFDEKIRKLCIVRKNPTDQELEEMEKLNLRKQKLLGEENINKALGGKL